MWYVWCVRGLRWVGTSKHQALVSIVCIAGEWLENDLRLDVDVVHKNTCVYVCLGGAIAGVVLVVVVVRERRGM